MADDEFPPVLTAAMAADLLHIHVEYLRKLVRDGKIPSHRFPGGRELRFLRDELLTWLQAQPGGTEGPGGDHHDRPSATDPGCIPT